MNAQLAIDRLFDAVSKGDAHRIQSLLRDGCDLNQLNANGMSVLALAAKKGRTDIVKLLLEHGADVNLTMTYYGWTALTYAVNNGHLETVKILLNYHADVNAKAHRGKTALLLAADRGYLEIVEVLLKHGADAGAVPDHHGWTAMGRAMKHGYVEIADVLRASEIR